jgi:hypothetical protein
MPSPLLLAALLHAAPAAGAPPVPPPADGIVVTDKKKKDKHPPAERREEKKEERQERRADRKQIRGERRAERRTGRLLRRNLTMSERPVRTLLVPGGTFNTDDGLGLGFLLSMRKLAPEYLDWLNDVEWFGEQKAATDLPSESVEKTRVRIDPGAAGIPRPWVWDLTVNALMFFSPQPSAWGGAARFSWIPEANAKAEFNLWVQTIGWTWAWYMGVGNDSRTDYRHQREDEEVGLTWHRHGLRDVALGASLDLALTGPLAFSAGIRFDLDALEVRPGTQLAQDAAAGLVAAPALLFGGGSDLALAVDSRDQRHDPTKGGTARGVFTATVSSIGLAARLTADVRGYQGIGPGSPVVLAGNIAANLQVGALPFYELGVLASSNPKPRLITGANSARGLQRGRLRGPLGLVLLGEVRFRPPGFAFGKRGRLRLEPVIFADAARVDEWERIGAGPPLHPGVGAGLRAILNEQLVVHADVGTGPDQIVDASGLEGAVWVVGAYLSVGQFF